MPSKRINHSMVYVGDNKLVMFGGYGSYRGAHYISDTWEYDVDSNNWTECSVTSKIPNMRCNHSMAYAGNGRLIMFGGYDSNKKSLSDTWECSAGSLTDKMTYEKDVPIMYVDKTSITYNDILLGDTSQESFSISNYGTASFDWSVSTAYAGDGKIVMFGGYGKNALDGVSSLADTWKYDYDTRKWTMVVCKTSPESRYYHSMAYAGEGKIVMFGGKCISGDESNLLSDTWIYDVSNNTWTEQTCNTHPESRYNHSIAYAGDGKIIMFGGYDESNLLSDTWIYDTSNNAWTECDIETIPLARSEHSITYAGNGKIVMFGGLDDGNIELNDTWVYDTSNNAWTECDIETIPLARSEHSIAYAGNGKIVMFGGKCISGDESNLLSDTWIYDVSNNTWTEVTSAETNPKQAYAHSMAYIGDGKVIMFDTDVNSSWMFDTTNNANIWKKYDIPQHMDKPASRTHQSMSYIGNGKVIMFGGEYIGTRFNDMWEYDGGNLVNEMNN